MPTLSWPFVSRGKPVHVSHAEGAWLHLKDGRRILDAGGGAIVVNVGHGRAEVADAIRDAALNATYVIPPWLTDERAELFEELGAHWLPEHLSHIHLACGGSEANESALKMAIQYHAARGEPDRNLVLARDISYHGTTVLTAGVSGHPARKKGLEGLLQTFERIETPYPLRCPLGPHHPDALDYYIKDLEATIARLGPGRIAALIAEPMNGSSGGAIMAPDGYWAAVQPILAHHGILLIMDEVMTGFGRTGEKFGSDTFEITPDLLVGGKGLAGGYAPIAGVFGTEAIAETIGGAGYDVMFHTFGALPQACAAATAVLRILRREALVERSQTVGANLLARLQERFGQHPNVAEIRGRGLLIGIEVVQDRDTLERFPVEAGVTNRLLAAGMEAGVFFYPGGTGAVRDIVCIGAPFIIDDQEIDHMLDALESALAIL